jgi:hypothetical protein
MNATACCRCCDLGNASSSMNATRTSGLAMHTDITRLAFPTASSARLACVTSAPSDTGAVEQRHRRDGVPSSRAATAATGSRLLRLLLTASAAAAGARRRAASTQRTHERTSATQPVGHMRLYPDTHGPTRVPRCTCRHGGVPRGADGGVAGPPDESGAGEVACSHARRVRTCGARCLRGSVVVPPPPLPHATDVPAACVFVCARARTVGVWVCCVRT